MCYRGVCSVGAEWPADTKLIHWHNVDTSTFDIGRTTVPVDELTCIELNDAPRATVDSYRLRSMLARGRPRSNVQVAAHRRATLPWPEVSSGEDCPFERPRGTALTPGRHCPRLATVEGRAYLDL